MFDWSSLCMYLIWVNWISLLWFCYNLFKINNSLICTYERGTTLILWFILKFFHFPFQSIFYLSFSLGLTLWNRNSLEFKFDDTRLSSLYENKIGPIEIFVCCFLTLLCLCPVGCLSLSKLNWDSQQGRVWLNWDSQQGRDIA